MWDFAKTNYSDRFDEGSEIDGSEIDVVLDIRPDNKRNIINPGSRGGIWVAVLSDSDFDPLQIDVETVGFGPDGAKALRQRVRDVNRDRLGDLLLRFKISETGIACGDTEAMLTGETFGGQSITGTDVVKTVRCKKKQPGVAIDIRPGNKRNVINPGSRGGIWVAILSDSDFDPLQLDIDTVRFGPAGASALRQRVRDVNRDRLGDLLLRFKISETGIACGDTEAKLTGETFGGQSITGTDVVKTVRCRR